MKKFFTKNNEATCSPLVVELKSLISMSGKKNGNELIDLSTYRLIDFKKPAFTLSEVLITLGIIGIVAVLTIPPVMKNYRNKLYASQLEKLYAQISDSVQASMLDEHTSNFYETIAAKDNSCSDAANGKCEDGAGYFLNKYFKILKRDCGAGSCYANAYQQMGTRNNVDDVMGGDYCIQTTGAATICMKKDTDEETQKVTYIFNVDINGMAEPNEAGRDAFTMKVLESGAIKDVSTSATDCGAPSAKGCLLKIMDDGWKMNY